MGAVIAIAALIVVAVLNPPAPNETVVVLPGPDGHVGGVVVERGAERYVLDRAYAGIRARESKVSEFPSTEVKKTFAATVQSLPPRPTLFRLYFVIGTDELTEESKAALPKVLDELRDRPVPEVLVVGHTDTMGDMLANDELSAQRAEAMKPYLVEIGIPAERIRVFGRGEREPLVPTGDNVDEPLNRRVEIIVR